MKNGEALLNFTVSRKNYLGPFGGGGGGGGGDVSPPPSLRTGPTLSSTQLTALKAITAISTYFNNFIINGFCGGTWSALNPLKAILTQSFHLSIGSTNTLNGCAGVFSDHGCWLSCNSSSPHYP
jgi:hypothetical protein